MIIYVFRHGQTKESKSNMNYSPERRINADILPETYPLIEKLASHLKTLPTEKNFTSPIKRCLQTVDIVKKVSQKEFEIDDALKEWMEPVETFSELSSRVSDFYKKLLSSGYQQVSLCTHGAVISGLKSIFENGSYPIERLHDYPMPGVLLIMDTKANNIKEIDFR